MRSIDPEARPRGRTWGRRRRHPLVCGGPTLRSLTPGRARRAALLAAGLLCLGGLTAATQSPSALPAGPTSTTGRYGSGTVLPDGRLLTPAGTLYDLGDYPLGAAVSPDGNLLVASDNGLGIGLSAGFNSYCGQGQNQPPNSAPKPCPYLARQLGAATAAAQFGDPNRPTYDQALSVVDLRSGVVHTVEAQPTVRDPIKAAQYDGTSASDNLTDKNYFYVGLAFSPRGDHLYASGGGNNAVYDFRVAGDVVQTPPKTLILPQPYFGNGTPVVGPLTPPFPVFGGGNAVTKGMAVSPDGATLLVAHEFNNTLDVIDTASSSLLTQVPLGFDPTPVAGASPYGVAVSPDGATAYVSLQGFNVVAVVGLAGSQSHLTALVPAGDHPTGIAVSPDGSQVYVADANDDTLDVLDVRNAYRGHPLTVQAIPGSQPASSPNAVTVSPDGQRIYVADAGDDSLAVLMNRDALAAAGGTAAAAPLTPPAYPNVPGAPNAARSGLPNTAAPASPPADQWVLAGMLPAGWYPSAVTTSGDGSTVFVVSAKGLGSRYPGTGRGGDVRSTYDDYDAENMPGLLQAIPAPSVAALRTGLLTVQQDILFATAADPGPEPGNPVPDVAHAGRSPITHVIEVVRENRTFDQVLGDVGVDQGRGPTQVDAQPGYALFGRDITANAHAFSGDPVPGHPDPAYATSDNFYSDGEASVQGHWWTTAANVTDYVEKWWRLNYSNRNRIYDPESTLSQPRNCTLFQSLMARGIEQRDYGELIGLTNVNVPTVPSGVTPPPVCAALPNAAIDPKAAQYELNLDADNRPQATEILADMGLNPDGSAANNGGSLRPFSYITLSGDHTGGLAFNETPRSRVAENDAALGMLISGLSRSSDWSSTAVFVMEDDSQDGLDHQDGHRNVLFVLSPYAKHSGTDGKPGYVGHRHYSQASVVKTIELILGAPFLSGYDQYASPLYDLFQDKPSAAQLSAPQNAADTAADLSPYTVQPLPSSFGVPESTACYGGGGPPCSPQDTQLAAGIDPAVRADLLRRSQRLDTSAIDRASPDLEVVAWQLAHPSLPVPAQLRRELDDRSSGRGVYGAEEAGGGVQDPGAAQPAGGGR